MSIAALRYAPEFQLQVGGQPAPAALRASVTSVVYQTGLKGADRVDLTIANENLRWLDHPLLALDGALSLSMGYAPDPLRQMFNGEIIALAPTFPASEAPLLRVAAQDRRRYMQRGGKARWFAIPTECVGNFPIPDMAVASWVAAENRLIPIMDPIGAALSVIIGGAEMAAAFGDPDAQQKLIRKQSGESDYVFLSRICAQNGWEMTIDHTGQQGGRRLRFLSVADSREAELRLRYGQSLNEFVPRVTSVGQIAQIAASFWVPTLRTEFTVAVGWDWDRSALTLDITPGFGLGANSQSVKVLNESLSAETAPRVLASALLEKLNTRLTATGVCIGDPRVQSGTVLGIEGVGEQFGGLYRVTSATHSINGHGYQTQFELRKEVWFGSVPLLEQGAVKVDVMGLTGPAGAP